MVKLLRFLRGYIVFIISGSCPEKFVNILTYNGVNVWGVQSRDGIVYCTTLAVNYKHIRRLSRRTSNKVRVKSKYGLPFFINRNKDRVGLPIGAVCFLLVFKLLSMFLWNIDIYGFTDISYNKAKSVMESVGIYEGAYAAFDSLNNIQTKAMIEFENVSWITVNVDGSKGEVNISEVTQKGGIMNADAHYNIKANVDAQIIRVDGYSGSAVVKSGDAVAKGNLLISGFVQTELGGTHLSTADGVVWAKTEHTESFSVPKTYTTAEYNPDSKCRYSCRLFNIVIPLKFDNYDTTDNHFSFVSEHKASFQDETASLSLINENVYFYDNDNITLNERTAENILKTEMLLNELFHYGDKKIISRTVESSVDDKNFNYTVKYNCEENIGEKSEIIIDDNFNISNEDTTQDEPED